jgi:hypothetical protein
MTERDLIAFVVSATLPPQRPSISLQPANARRGAAKRCLRCFLATRNRECGATQKRQHYLSATSRSGPPDSSALWSSAWEQLGPCACSSWGTLVVAPPITVSGSVESYAEAARTWLHDEGEVIDTSPRPSRRADRRRRQQLRVPARATRPASASRSPRSPLGRSLRRCTR